MRGLLNRVFGLRPGEWKAVLPFFVLQAGVAAYWAVSAPAGDALLLSLLRQRSIPVAAVVPWTYLAVAAVTAAVVAAFDALQSRIPRRRLLVGAPLALGLSVAAFRLLLAWDAVWVRFALSVWLEVAAVVSLIIAFAAAGDHFGSRDAKRLYGFIGGGFCVGLAAGGAAVPWLTRSAGVEALLLVAACLLWGNAAVTALLARGGAGGLAADEGPVGAAPLRALAGDGCLRPIAAAVFLGGALFVLVDFQLKSAASALPRDAIAALYGRLYGWAGAGEALILFVLLGPLIRRAGVLNLQLVYPSLMLAGSAASLRSPGLGVVAGANLARMVSMESVERPTRELLYLPVAPRLRARAQPLIDGAAASLGQAAGALLVLAVTAATASPRALPAAAAALAALALLPLLRLRPRYRSLLASAVRSRPLEAVDLARLAHEPGARETLAELLRSGDEHEARFARGVLEKAGDSPRTEREERGLGALTDPALTDARRCAAVAALGQSGGPASGEALWSLLPGAGSALAAAACRAMLKVQRRGAWEGPSSRELSRRRAEQARALIVLADAAKEAGGGFPAEVLRGFAAARCDGLLSLLSLNGGPAVIDNLRLDLWSQEPSARGAALELAEEVLPAAVVQALSSWPSAPREAAPSWRPRTRASLAALEPALARLLDGGPAAARAARLAQLELLSGLEAPYLAQLLESSREWRLEEGQSLFCAGDNGEALYLIEEGAISVRLAGREVAELGPGECLGELSVLDGLPRSADAFCARAGRGLLIAREAFRDVAAGRPAVGLALVRTLERRLRAAAPDAGPRAAAPGAPRPRAGGAADARGRLLTAAALRRVALLDGLPDAILASVAALARPIPVYAGETLFEQGDRGETLFLISAGRVSIDAGPSRLAELGPGEVFGDLALLGGGRRAAAARVSADGLLYGVGGADFGRLLRDEPAVLWSLLETLARRLRASLSATPSGPPH